jgi:hypothetical protein
VILRGVNMEMVDVKGIAATDGTDDGKTDQTRLAGD